MTSPVRRTRVNRPCAGSIRTMVVTRTLRERLGRQHRGAGLRTQTAPVWWHRDDPTPPNPGHRRASEKFGAVHSTTRARRGRRCSVAEREPDRVLGERRPYDHALRVQRPGFGVGARVELDAVLGVLVATWRPYRVEFERHVAVMVACGVSS